MRLSEEGICAIAKNENKKTLSRNCRVRIDRLSWQVGGSAVEKFQTRSLCKLHLELLAAVARPSFESLPTLPHNQRYQAQGGHWIGPGDSPESVRNEACERDDGQVAAKRGLRCVRSQCCAGGQGGQPALLLREQRHHHRCDDQYENTKQAWPRLTASKQRQDRDQSHVGCQHEQKTSSDAGGQTFRCLLPLCAKPSIHHYRGEEFDGAVAAESQQHRAASHPCCREGQNGFGAHPADGDGLDPTNTMERSGCRHGQHGIHCEAL